MTIARRRGLAVAAIGLAATAPSTAAAAPGWTMYPGPAPTTIDDEAQVDHVELDRDGTARVFTGGKVVSRSPAGEWRAPGPEAGSTERGAAALARVVDGQIVVALRGAGGAFGRGEVVAPAGPGPVGGASPTAAVSENGDAVVAWIRRPSGGPERLVAAVKQAGRPWSATRVLAQGVIGGRAVVVDVRGTAVVMWGQGDLRRGPGVQPLQRIRVAERGLGAPRWSAARTLGLGQGSALALAADAEGTVHALWARTSDRPKLIARRAPGSGWRIIGAVPRSGCCTALMRVSPFGDVFVVDPWTSTAGGVSYRPAGVARWRAMPGEAPTIEGVGGISLDLEANSAGDAVLAWAQEDSLARMPLRAAYYEAPARPALTAFSARRAGKRVVLEFELSAPGRVLVQVRRRGFSRILDGFIATARGGRTAIAVPARVRALLAKPGRYELRADTGGRDEAASTRTATLTTP